MSTHTPFQPEYTLGVGADCFMGAEQCRTTLFLTYERGKSSKFSGQTGKVDALPLVGAGCAVEGMQ